MKSLVCAVTLAALSSLSGLALAKLPAPSDEAKAKAAEAAAKAAYGNKVGAYQLCKSQNAVAAQYIAQGAKAGKTVPPVANVACEEPGAFVYAPPAPKPIEAAGAHSPAATAVGPPSGKAPAAEVTGVKKP